MTLFSRSEFGVLTDCPVKTGGKTSYFESMFQGQEFHDIKHVKMKL